MEKLISLSLILCLLCGCGAQSAGDVSKDDTALNSSAAMVYSHYEDITLAEVKEILLSFVKELNALDGQTVTGGMLDLDSALSYDLDNLSGEVWNTPDTPSGSGSAPTITAKLVARNNQQYLQVQVLDEDGNLAVTAYAAGVLSVEHFRGGSGGQSFTVDSSGTILFSATTGGTYTFYACDAAGTETVQAVRITRSTGQAGAVPVGSPVNTMPGGRNGTPTQNIPAAM